MTLPKWATPERQAELVEMFARSGNKCLLGHPCCPIVSHYFYNETRGEKLFIPVTIPARDRNENQLRNSKGEPLSLTVYITKTIPVSEPKFARLYERLSELAIAGWVSDDRALNADLWRIERAHIHGLGERTYPLRGRFSAISKDIYYASQPEYYLAGLSVDGLTFRPFAKVRLASGYTFLYVSLGDILRRAGKCKRRKAIRYGRPLPPNIEAEIVKVCNMAVRQYLATS